MPRPLTLDEAREIIGSLVQRINALDAENARLVPEAQVDHLVSLRPTRCHGCGAALRGRDPAPRRQQVTELPVGPPMITEYGWHTLACERCGVATTTPRPSGVPAGAFGPRLTATVAVCTGVYPLSRRRARRWPPRWSRPCATSGSSR